MEEARKLQALSAEVEYQHGRLLEAEGDLMGAAARYENVVIIDPRHVEGLTQLGSVLLKLVGGGGGGGGGGVMNCTQPSCGLIALCKHRIGRCWRRATC